MNEGLITDISQLDLQRKYSYAEYLKWRFTEFVELIKGKVFIMSPAPLAWHQNISANVFLSLGVFLKDKDCKIFTAPFDVRLSSINATTDEAIETVVQPDICIICDRTKIDRRGCLGSPDLIIEITSPGTEKKDLTVKFDLYESSGVREYWVVFAEAKYLNQYVLNADEKYELEGTFFSGDQLRSVVLPEYNAEVTTFFAL